MIISPIKFYIIFISVFKFSFIDRILIIIKVYLNKKYIKTYKIFEFIISSIKKEREKID